MTIPTPFQQASIPLFTAYQLPSHTHPHTPMWVGSTTPRWNAGGPTLPMERCFRGNG
jgi:hypothetical protein